MRVLSILFFVWLASWGYLGCKIKSQLSEKLIDACIWDLYDLKQKPTPMRTYKFYRSDSLTVYTYMYTQIGIPDSLIKVGASSDYIREKIWNVVGDTVLNIEGFKMSIDKIGTDTIFLSSIDRTDSLILVRNCISKVPN